jgi:LuxR family maltose regulon positive regulatory protein
MHTVARHNHNKYTEVWGSYMQGSTFLQAHDLEKAVDHFATVAEQRYIFHIRAAVDALAALSLTRQLMHEPDAAADSLDQLVSFAREKGDPSYIAVADSCRARISLLKGDLPAAAMQWAESVDGSAVPMELFVFLEVPQITRARVLITQSSKKNLEKALESLNQLRHQSEKCYYTCQIIEIAVLQSLALKKLGQTEQALDILTEVVALAGPLGWNRPFIEAGPLIIDLLEYLQSQKEGNYYAEMLLKALKGIKPVENAPIPEHHIKDSPAVKNPEPELLSQRELEIIRLLAQGLNNKEIAASLFLSAHTIKTHLYNIYQKWDVHSRTSLIAKARKLGIFSE